MVAPFDNHDAEAAKTAPTVFVRDFMGKFALLALYHDLGCASRPGRRGPDIDEHPRAFAATLGFVLKRNWPGHRLQAALQKAEQRRLWAAIHIAGPDFAEATFRTLVKSDQVAGTDCLTARRRRSGSPSHWNEELHQTYAVGRVSRLLGLTAKSDPNPSQPFMVGVRQSADGHLCFPIREGYGNRDLMRLCAGALLRPSSGPTIGTLERTTARHIGNRDYVHQHLPYEPDDLLVTEVETSTLMRLARLFGFGCQAEVTSGLDVWDRAIGGLNERLRSVWQQFAGASPREADGPELRGGTLESFSTAYFDLLKAATSSKAGLDKVLYLEPEKPAGTRTVGKVRPTGDGGSGEASCRFNVRTVPIDGGAILSQNHVSYGLHLHWGQKTVTFDVNPFWTDRDRDYAFTELALTVSEVSQNSRFELEPYKGPRRMIPLSNGGSAVIRGPGPLPDYMFSIGLTNVTNLPEWIFANAEETLFTFKDVEVGTSFLGEFHVRAGSLACVRSDDDSTVGGLRIAVEQFLALHGRQDANDMTYVKMSAKVWTIAREDRCPTQAAGHR